jgi:CsoR family transcriptional regulator, copper-sensing transcriptional repressor
MAEKKRLFLIIWRKVSILILVEALTGVKGAPGHPCSLIDPAGIDGTGTLRAALIEQNGGQKMCLPPELPEQLQGDILARLKKIEGLVRGLQGMIQDSRDCDQILAQVRAVQSALKSVNQLVLKSYLLKCCRAMGTEPRPAEIMQKLAKMVGILTKFIEG